MEQTPEQLEYAISQYLDGTLPLLERQVLEARLQKDESARALLGEYRSLDAIVKNALPAPAIAWEKLSASISAQVDEIESPATTYRMTFTSVVRFAVAAIVLIAVGLFALTRLESHKGTLSVTGPSLEVAAAAPVSDVSIGPSPAIASAEDSLHSSEVIISRPATVIIASFEQSAQDSDELPYGG